MAVNSADDEGSTMPNSASTTMAQECLGAMVPASRMSHANRPAVLVDCQIVLNRPVQQHQLLQQLGCRIVFWLKASCQFLDNFIHQFLDSYIRHCLIPVDTSSSVSVSHCEASRVPSCMHGSLGMCGFIDIGLNWSPDNSCLAFFVRRLSLS